VNLKVVNFVELFNSKIGISIRAANPIDIVPHALDGVLYHVKGFLPAVGRFSTIGDAHSAPTYANAIAQWSLVSVLGYTTLPIVLAVLALFAIYLGLLGAYKYGGPYWAAARQGAARLLARK
jgi:hypothetical protein